MLAKADKNCGQSLVGTSQPQNMGTGAWVLTATPVGLLVLYLYERMAGWHWEAGSLGTLRGHMEGLVLLQDT